MAFSLVSHTSAGSTDDTDVTTSGINTSGATLIVVFMSDNGSAIENDISDSKSNTWTALTVRGDEAGNGQGRFFYSISPTVGSGHTFSASTVPSSYPCLFVAAFSGASPTFDHENGAATSSGESLAAGSVTPSSNGALVISGLSHVYPFPDVTVGASLTIIEQITAVTHTIPGELAYYIQPTAGAINPTWDWTGDGSHYASAVIACFTLGGGGGGGSWKPYFAAGANQ